MKFIPKTKVEKVTIRKVFTVAEFINFLNEILVPKRAIVQGEVGKGIYNHLRYLIFNLLDKKEEAILKCFVWRDRLENFGIELEEGMEIKVFGYPRIYESRGELTFEIEKIALVGEEVLKKQFEILKKKLANEGLFDPSFKKTYS